VVKGTLRGELVLRIKPILITPLSIALLKSLAVARTRGVEVVVAEEEAEAVEAEETTTMSLDSPVAPTVPSKCRTLRLRSLKRLWFQPGPLR